MGVRLTPVALEEHQIHAWMQRLLVRAERLGETGEIPVSAVVLDERGAMHRSRQQPTRMGLRPHGACGAGGIASGSLDHW